MAQRIGTFDGRAGSQDWRGVLSMADARIELEVADRWVEESGERMVRLQATASMPANEFSIEWEMPEYSANHLLEQYRQA